VRPVTRGGAPSVTVNKGKPKRQTLTIPFDTYVNFKTQSKTPSRKIGLFKAGPTVQKAYGLGNGRPDPTYWAVVRGLMLLEVNIKPATWAKSRWKALGSVYGAVIGRLEKIYKQAGPPLKTQLGPFCSYCEQKLSGEFQVEHLVPKGPYPYMYLPWGNFLLSCGPCNTAKLGEPTRATSDGWGVYNNEIERVVEIRSRYLWPDTSAALAYQLMKPVLEWEETPNNWLVVDDPVRQNTTIDSSTDSTREVRGTVYAKATGALAPAWQNNVPIRVRMLASGAGPDKARADLTVGLWKPNYVTPHPEDTLYDLRMFNRTTTWVTMVFQCRYAMAATAGEFPDRWKAFLLTVAGAGHFSVILRILELQNAAGTPVPTGGGNFMQRFLNDINGVVLGQTIFPGTNTVGLP
jgi:hypothetical protein